MNVYCSFAAVAWFALVAGCTTPPEEGQEAGGSLFADQELSLTWSDEFEGEGAPDPANWTAEDKRPGWVNDELQNYVPERLENARLEGGSLIIEAHHDDFDGHPYSSARLHSQGKADFAYGRFEVRAKLPRGRGTWPAIWMMPTDVFKYASTCDAQTGWIPGCDAWPNSGEIDIMEHVGHDPGVVHASLHMERFNWISSNQPTRFVTVDDVFDTFHVYALEKTESEIRTFVDDRMVLQFKNADAGWESWPFNEKFHFILNVAVGGSWGGVDGVDPEAFPARMEIDYVRVYELAE